MNRTLLDKIVSNLTEILYYCNLEHPAEYSEIHRVHPGSRSQLVGRSEGLSERRRLLLPGVGLLAEGLRRGLLRVLRKLLRPLPLLA